MALQAQITTLKQHLEQLFPGKWISGKEGLKTLLTGLPEIDRCLSNGLARQRITEWTGAASSGKTTLLHAAVANWCKSGFDVSYVDTGSRLLAADWSSVDQGQGRFWVIRSPPGDDRIKSVLYVTEQLLRSNAFDVIVLDLDDMSQLSSRMYARLQRSLARSKAALIILHDAVPVPDGWGCHTRLSFCWGDKAQYNYGLNGIAAIVPQIQIGIWRDGLSKNVEVTAGSHVTNRLFTHSPVPDRRTPKARA